MFGKVCVAGGPFLSPLWGFAKLASGKRGAYNNIYYLSSRVVLLKKVDYRGIIFFGSH